VLAVLLRLENRTLAPATLMPWDEARVAMFYITNQQRQSAGRSTGRLFTGEAYEALRPARPCA
jgi:hypothetical protein